MTKQLIENHGLQIFCKSNLTFDSCFKGMLGHIKYKYIKLLAEIIFDVF